MPPARIGLIVPSSNVTVETEIPRILARASSIQFSFHSSRMRMHAVTPEQLLAMNAQRERCVLEIGDANVDALLYACLVAIMATGPGGVPGNGNRNPVVPSVKTALNAPHHAALDLPCG